jgi:hypothetical protein
VSTEVDLKQTQWQKLFGYVLGNQAAWIADIGLKAGLFRAIAEAGNGGTTEEALAQRSTTTCATYRYGAEGPTPSNS